METFDGRQITAARALASITLAELAAEAGVTLRTVHRLETGGELHISERRRHAFVSLDVWARLAAALARRGVELLPETGRCGSGVRWMKRRADRSTQTDVEGPA